MIGNSGKRRRFDEVKHTLRTGESILEVCILVLIYYLIWKTNYREGGFPYYGNGKYILAGIYGALITVIFSLCDSFKFGHLKLSDVVVSQWIAMLIVNGITYFQLCLIANRMVNPVPILLLTCLDIVCTFFLVYVYIAVYHIYNMPRNMVMIYGSENALDLKFKMETRSDKYRVTKIINADRGYDAIRKEIGQYDAVILNDIPAQIRNDLMKYCYQNEIPTYVVPKISDILMGGAEDICLFDVPLLLVKGKGLTGMQRLTKRAMDLILSLIAAILFSPLMLIVAAAIRLEDGGPVFYRQKRITLGGKEFEILKFRSMIVDAEKPGYSIPATGSDPRITKVGRMIRPCRIDELPQIFNIIRGDMSIVGPRPERVEHVEQYQNEIPEFAFRNKVKGGLTGYAQIYGKYNTSAYDKLRLDLMYMENYSLLLDIKLIFMTLQILVRRESTEGFEKVYERNVLRTELLSGKQ